MKVRQEKISWSQQLSTPCLFIMCLLLLVCTSTVESSPLAKLLPKTAVQTEAETEESAQKNKPPAGPADDFNRGTPRSSAKGFSEAIESGEFDKAAEYLDLRNLPKDFHSTDGHELSRKLKVIVERAFWVDLDDISNDPKGKPNDGLPVYRDSLGQIKAGKDKIDILMQRVPRGDGVWIWKLSNKTVKNIPLLYQYHGYTELEEYLNSVFPDIMILGWPAWQWASWTVLILLCYMIVWLPTAIAGRFIRRCDTEINQALSHYITRPLRFVAWIVSVHLVVEYLGPSETIRKMFEAGPLLYLALTWAVLRLVDLAELWLGRKYVEQDRQASLVLLKPIKSFCKVIVVLAGILLWLDNLGVNVGTLLASLGIGGLAIALAAQDTLKNLLGSVMILVDRPYEIGQRINVKSHDGVVEEIGLRSTKMRLLTGHQVSIPNEEMAKVDIENIGRRPHIRRSSNLAIPLDTPAEKVEQAVNILRKNLENHECMDPDYPPRIFFNDFRRDSINIQMLIWYRSSDFWAFQAFNQKLNLKIMNDFSAAGIKFAVPSFLTYGNQDRIAPAHDQANPAMQFSEG